MKLNAKIIGCGGIATWLLPPLCRFLAYDKTFESVQLSIIDGDAYEERNKERQVFLRPGNKAEVTVESMREQFPEKIWFYAYPTYLTRINVAKLIRQGDIVFVCVDNYNTRKLVSDRCQDTSDLAVISGGNEYEDGNIQCCVRRGGKNLLLPLANEYHTEIQKPTDENPGDRARTPGCDVQATEGAPQLVVTNAYVAMLMLAAFHNHLNGTLDYDEAYVDVRTNTVRKVCRSKTGGKLS